MVTLYIGFATFFRGIDFTLHNTVYERDIRIEHDCFTGKASSESKGVRIKYASADSLVQ